MVKSCPVSQKCETNKTKHIKVSVSRHGAHPNRKLNFRSLWLSRAQGPAGSRMRDPRALGDPRGGATVF